MRTTLLAALALTLSVGACGSGDPAPDGGPARDGSDRICASDSECDDGLFCTGVERCAPGAGSGPDGCVRPGARCLDGQSCDEADDACETVCTTTRDADGDGRDAVECGGDDCADDDATTYPGNAEVCDPTGHDEDCDTTTYGDRDLDEDGFVDVACCNTGADGTERCGNDCADTDTSRSPGTAEVCDTIDNDCDGATDERFTDMRFYRDADGDFFGDPGDYVEDCAAPEGYVADSRDCDDSDAEINPLGARACDGVDTACEGAPDLGCPESIAVAAAIVESPAFGPTIGTETRSACPAGSVMVGLDSYVMACTDTERHVGGVRIVCAPPAFASDTSVVPYTYSITLGSSTVSTPIGCTSGTVYPGSIVQGRCPAGTAVTRVEGRHDPRTNGFGIGPLRVYCSTLGIGGEVDAFELARGTPTRAADSGGYSTSTPFDYTCPEGMVAVGVRARVYSDDLSQIGFLCAAIDVEMIGR